jgi:NAD(P)-dependent dehydrogenase (short-subunit alcohol dehydrogenase family)
MAKRNANTILVDVNLESGKRVYREIESLGKGRSLALRADVSNGNEVGRVVENVLREFGRIDILVNNAAIGGPAVPITLIQR